MKGAALALAALAGATLAPAQQTPSQTQTPAEPPARTTPQDQTTAPARLSEVDKRILTTDCMRQVQADNPNVSGKKIRAYCDKAVESYSTPR